MARAKKQGAAQRRATVSRDVWRGEEGRCGECQTRRRPVSRYAGAAEKDRWLCDQCVIDDMLAGIRYLPWEQREMYRADPNAAYSFAPMEPAPRPGPVVGEDGPEAAVAGFGPVGWEDEDGGDDEDELQRKLSERSHRLGELRRLGVAVTGLFQAATTPNEERPGLLRVIELLQARMRELGG